MAWKPLPIGVDNFEELITKDYFFVDKTLFIRDLLDMKGEVNLFTRPRRFGKTLNMSMLRYFFEMEEDNAGRLFAGTKTVSYTHLLFWRSRELLLASRAPGLWSRPPAKPCPRVFRRRSPCWSMALWTQLCPETGSVRLLPSF